MRISRMIFLPIVLYVGAVVSCNNDGNEGSDAGPLDSGVDGGDSGEPEEWIAVEVSCGSDHTCARTMTGEVKCWGSNSHGQIGHGSLQAKDGTVFDVVGLESSIKELAAGSNHNCVVTDERTVYCWGYNLYGQLGSSEGIEIATPVLVPGMDESAVVVVAGSHHTCALMEAGDVKCWGRNDFGQLGNGTTSQSTEPESVVGLAEDIEMISAAGSVTCAIGQSGAVYCWGAGYLIGDGTGEDSPVPVIVETVGNQTSQISSGLGHCCAVDETEDAYCWGLNDFGKLGDGTEDDSYTPTQVLDSTGFQRIEAGGVHTCAITTDERVKCWGDNTHYELGNETLGENSTTPQYVIGIEETVTGLSSGTNHSCAITTDGRIQCWGRNNNGQLGDGTEIDSAVPQKVANDSESE